MQEETEQDPGNGAGSGTGQGQGGRNGQAVWADRAAGPAGACACPQCGHKARINAEFLDES